MSDNTPTTPYPPTNPSDLQAELDRLRQENAQLKQQVASDGGAKMRAPLDWEHEKEQADALLAGMKQKALSPKLAVSTVFHAILIGVSSIAFIQLCLEWGTLDPKTAIKVAAEEKRTAEKQAAEEAAAETAEGEEGSETEGTDPETPAEAGKEPEPTPNDADAPAVEPSEKPTTETAAKPERKTMQERLSEKSYEKPTDTNVDLFSGDLDDDF